MKNQLDSFFVLVLACYVVSSCFMQRKQRGSMLECSCWTISILRCLMVNIMVTAVTGHRMHHFVLGSAFSTSRRVFDVSAIELGQLFSCRQRAIKGPPVYMFLWMFSYSSSSSMIRVAIDPSMLATVAQTLPWIADR